MGIEGRSLYYRAAFPSNNKSVEVSNPLQENLSAKTLNDLTIDGMKEIETADLSRLVDSNSKELLKELNSKNEKVLLWPLCAALFVFCCFISMKLLIVGIPLTLLTYFYDEKRKRAVIMYDLEPETELAFHNFYNAFEELRSCNQIWHIEASGDSKDIKYTSGASKLIRRKQSGIEDSAPPYVSTNISTPSINVGKQDLFFFPDKILVYEKNKVGAVSYSELELEISNIKFVETESVPSDSEIVDRTWRYVNKKGGPDKRFKDNKELPIALYSEIYFRSKSGLNEMINCSKKDMGTQLNSAIKKQAEYLTSLPNLSQS